MDYLPDSDIEPVTRRSSINQYDGFLGVMHKGMFCPIVFDMMDGIVCGKIHSHKVIAHFGDWIGYHYPIKKCKYSKRTYVIGQDVGEGVHILPEQFGHGDCWHNNFYEEKHNHKGYMKGDDGSFVGYQTDKELIVGLDYITANDVLEPID